ncbi:MAG: response regulator [Chromatiaceae bacterium]|jgi:CheY-like chemotaxis protein|nr:response regulator [Chromatiaceae bacterium]MBP6733445.1 response regulator [Chromatiaceae bacterium]MBP6806832.1 response regulator [Chromatiaceae bacterium]MBP8282694.1 response regulator [Chromatiaceae bacterium]MBP8288407.1 response regulator [Chromatiaceae bacterium]
MISELNTAWRGTAADLAATTAGYFHELGQVDPKLNERLVRFYVQKRVISPPEREGGDGGGFSYRHLLELVVARELLRDRWPLEKIATLIREADEKALLDLIDNPHRSAPQLIRTVISQAYPETRRLVLAVNDDPQADLALYEWLASRGAAVLRAYSTTQALRLLAWARVHVVISDLARLEGEVMNKRAGMDLARRIRERGSDVPLVIFTLDKSPQVRELAVDAGANYVTEGDYELRDWLTKMGI